MGAVASIYRTGLLSAHLFLPDGLGFARPAPRRPDFRARNPTGAQNQQPYPEN